MAYCARGRNHQPAAAGHRCCRRLLHVTATGCGGDGVGGYGIRESAVAQGLAGRDDVSLRVVRPGRSLPGPRRGTPAHVPGAAQPGQFSQTDLERLTHGRLLPTGSAQVTVRSGGAFVVGTSARIGTDPGYDGMATLTSGRWPTSPDEVLLGGLGLANGLPTHGTVDIVDRTPSAVRLERSVRIVGTVRTIAPVLLVELPDASTATTWILLRDRPIDADEAVSLTRYGVSVADREQVANSETSSGGDQGLVTLMLSMLTAGIVVVIAAMVAPVFAVGATRSRRALAVLAGNGATTAQRRRYVLSQALLVGVGAAIIAPVAGALIGAVALLVYRQHSPGAWAGPVVVPWPWGLLMAGVAVTASLTAALLPAIAASRRPVVSSLAVNPSPAARGGVAVAGLVIGAASSALVWRGVRAGFQGPMASPSGAALPLAIGGIGLFVGALMIVPWLLGRWGAMAAHLPAAPRLALRDLARQRTRGTAVVGSVLATVGVMIAMLIPLTSQRASEAYTFQPVVAPGDLRVSAPGTYDGSPIRAAAAATLLGSRVIPLSIARPGLADGGASARTLLLAAAGCEDNPATWSSLGAQPCRPALSTNAVDVQVGLGVVAGQPELATGTPQDLASLYRLTVEQRSVLQSGGMVLAPEVAKAAGLSSPSGSLTLRSAVVTRQETSHPRVEKVQTFRLRYILATQRLAIPPLNPHAVELGVVPNTGALVTTTAAVGMGANTPTGEFLVRRDGGLDDGDADRLRADLAASGYSVEGPDSPPRRPDLRVPVLAVGGLLILIAICSGVFLSQSDRRREDEVFQRLGAGRGLRRRVNAWWAATATFVGVVVGLVAGWVPGTAMAIEARSRAEVYAAPWGTVAALVVGAPVVAALLAGVFTRRTP